MIFKPGSIVKSNSDCLTVLLCSEKKVIINKNDICLVLETKQEKYNTELKLLTSNGFVGWFYSMFDASTWFMEIK